MSGFNPEHFTAEDYTQPPASHISWRDLGAQTKAMLVSVYGAKILTAFAWAASFSTINPMGNGVFLADLLPFTLPAALQDISVGSVLNISLGAMAVITPSVLWYFILKYDVLRNVREFFEGNALRMTIGGILIATYALTITLEVISLLARIDQSIDTGPLPVLGGKAEILPLALVSSALVLGSCLLGLASAALSHSIQKRYV